MTDTEADVRAVNSIPAMRTILDVIALTTGMGFAAVARVTDDRWIACAVKDEIAFGLQPGGELQLETTICHEIRRHREPVVIDNVAEDLHYSGHPTPRFYKFQSYISMPIILPDGHFFGTLCAIGPRPARLNTPEVVGMFRLFAELIAFHLVAIDQVNATEARLLDEQKSSELREQFIAVLGHDLRNPLSAIAASAELLPSTGLNDDAMDIVRLIMASAVRMCRLINNIMDFARGRLGSGLTLDRNADEPLGPVLHHVVAELQARSRDRIIHSDISLCHPVRCSRLRIAQLLSNLLGNALTYGSPAVPVRVHAATDETSFELSVANGGDPIPPEALAKLFEPFTRGAGLSHPAGPGNPQRPPEREGLGLGLFIASEVAKAHGGTLTVASSAEETRFTFRMPLA